MLKNASEYVNDFLFTIVVFATIPATFACIYNNSNSYSSNIKCNILLSVMSLKVTQNSYLCTKALHGC